MDTTEAVATPESPRRPVKDFSRRNFVVFFMLLFGIPTVYFLSYVLGVQSGTQPPPPIHIHLPTQSISESPILTDTSFFNVVKACWNAAPRLLPYAVGQYLLGLDSDLNQPFVWANGALLSMMILTCVGVFDVLVNPELKGPAKTVWAVALFAGSAIGAPLPLLVYWYLYMLLEPAKVSVGKA